MESWLLEGAVEYESLVRPHTLRVVDEIAKSATHQAKPSSLEWHQLVGGE